MILPLQNQTSEVCTVTVWDAVAFFFAARSQGGTDFAPSAWSCFDRGQRMAETRKLTASEASNPALNPLNPEGLKP